VWGNSLNIIWSSINDDNIVWGNLFEIDDNIVWGNGLDDDNIVWGNASLLGNVLTTSWSGGAVSSRADNARARRTHVQEVVVQ